MSKATNAYMPLCAFSPWPYGRQVLPSCYKYRPSSSPLSSVVCTSKSTVTSPALSLSLARNQVEYYNMTKFAVGFHLNSFSYLCFVLFIHLPYRVHYCLDRQRSLRWRQRLFTIRTPRIPCIRTRSNTITTTNQRDTATLPL